MRRFRLPAAIGVLALVTGAAASPAADGASIRGSGSGEPPRIISKSNLGSSRDAATAVPALSAARSLAEAQDAILHLTVRDAGGRPVSSGTAFLIDRVGLAVTNHHVVAQGHSAVARLVDNPDRLPVELVHVIADLDLALIRVALPRGTAARHLRIEPEQQPLGTRVYALGFPEGVGYTLTSGIVSGYRRFDQLPWDLAGLCPSSTWVQSDCALNPGNSGGPLVTEDGAVVAINTWRYLPAESFSFSVASMHVTELLESAPEDPVTFAGVDEDAVLGPDTIELPRIEIRRNVSGSRVIRRTVALARRVDCRRCDGAGTVQVRRHVGYQGSGGWRQRVFRRSTVACDLCDGSGLLGAEALHRLLRYLGRDLARMRDDSRSEQALENAGRQLPALVGRLAREDAAAFADATESQLLAGNPDPGTPVAMLGVLLDRLPTAENAWLLSIPELELPVVMTDPRLLEAEAGDRVLAGGLLAGVLELSDDIPVLPVVQGGFVVGR